jgi:FkbM family methyltransferase
MQAMPMKQRHQIYNMLGKLIAPRDERLFSVDVENGHSILAYYHPLDYVSFHMYFWGYSGVYEPGIAALIRRLLPQTTVFIEIGANIGYYTLLAAANAPRSATIHAFEPNPTVFLHLQRNLSVNHFPNVHPVEAVVSDADTTVDLHIPSDPTARTNASVVADFWESDTRIPVRSWRLDTYCREQGLQTIDLLKIDAEGAEALVLRGLGDLLQEWQPDIICEVLPAFAEGIESALAGTTYRRYAITLDKLVPIDRMTESLPGHDIYLTTREVHETTLPTIRSSQSGAIPTQMG